jgi:probable rRNA maturation factor
MKLSIDILVEDDRWSDAMNLDDITRRAVDAVMARADPDCAPNAEVSFLFCDDTRIRALNAAWRAKDSSTNVLSFPAPEAAEWSALGDVALAYDTVAREAADEAKTVEQHTTHLIVHGVLHLIGYDHENDVDATEMELLESEILVSLGLPDPWREERSPLAKVS